MNCDGCKLSLRADGALSCHTCKSNYHYECLNIKVEQFRSLSKDFLSNWACPACTNVTRRVKSNLNTSVRANQVPAMEQYMDMSMDLLDKSESSSSSPPEPVSMAKFNELINTIDIWRSDMNSNMVSIRDDIKGSLSEIQAEIKSLRKDYTSLKQDVCNMNTEIACIQHSLQYQTEDYNALKKRVDDLARTANDQTMTATSNLMSRIDSLEQQARQTNVEICGVPERRNENLVGILEAISKSIHHPFTKGDLVAIHRVPHAHQGSNRPKNIIAKFTTRIQRDNILAAYRKTKSLKSDQLGIEGTPSAIYLNEHLTLQKKQLLRKCRETVRELNCKHVWIRNSTILVRETDDSPALAIRGEGDLEKLKNHKRK